MGLWPKCVHDFADAVIKGDCLKALGTLFEQATTWMNFATPGVPHLGLWRAGEQMAGLKIGDLTKEKPMADKAASKRMVFLPKEVDTTTGKIKEEKSGMWYEVANPILVLGLPPTTWRQPGSRSRSRSSKLPFAQIN